MAASLKMHRNPVTQTIRVSLTGTYTAATAAVSSGPSQTFSAGTLATRQAAGDDTQGAALASGVLTITPGFVPLHVKAVNVTDRIHQEFFVGMNDGDYLEQVAAGTRTLETDDKLLINATTGVTIVTLSDLSVGDNDSMIVELHG